MLVFFPWPARFFCRPGGCSRRWRRLDSDTNDLYRYSTGDPGNPSRHAQISLDVRDECRRSEVRAPCAVGVGHGGARRGVRIALAFVGAWTVTRVLGDVVRSLLPLILLAVAVYTFKKRFWFDACACSWRPHRNAVCIRCR